MTIKVLEAEDPTKDVDVWVVALYRKAGDNVPF